MKSYKGSRFDPALSRAQISAAVRKQFREQQKSGELPAHWKIRVLVRTGGIDILVSNTAVHDWRWDYDTVRGGWSFATIRLTEQNEFYIEQMDKHLQSYNEVCDYGYGCPKGYHFYGYAQVETGERDKFQRIVPEPVYDNGIVVAECYAPELDENALELFGNLTRAGSTYKEALISVHEILSEQSTKGA